MKQKTRKVKRFDNSRVVHDGIVNTLLGAGGRNDKRAYNQWTNKNYSLAELTNIYRSNWIARKIVDTIAEDMTAKWRSVYFGGDTNKIKQFEKLEKQLKIKKTVTNAIKEARLYGTSFILLGNNTQDLSIPRNPTAPIDYLTTLNTDQVKKDGLEIEYNFSSSGFGYPLNYRVQLTVGASVLIHNSWLLRVDACYTPSHQFKNATFITDSVLLPVMDAIERYEMNISSSSQLLSESSIAVLKSKRLAELLTQPNGKEKATNYFYESMAGKSVFKTTIIDGDDELIRLNAQLGGIFELLRSNMMELSGATGMPMQRLFGETQTGLSTGNTSADNYYLAGIARQQEDLLLPILDTIDPILLSMIGSSDGFESEFNPLWSETQATLATILKTRAEAMGILVDKGALLPSMMLKDLIEEKLISVSDEDMATIEEMDLNYEAINIKAGEVPQASTTGLQGETADVNKVTD